MDGVRIRTVQKPELIQLEKFKIQPKKRFPKKYFIYIFIAVVVAAGGFVSYRYFLSRGNADTAAAVSKIYLLPEGETPTIATVTDPDKLKSKIFFANAKSGDKVLIYTKADKVILYRPSENKIINVDRLKTSDIGTTPQ